MPPTAPASLRSRGVRLESTSTLALLSQVKAWVANVVKKAWPKHETLSDLIELWRSSDPARPSSPEWNGYTAETKRLYETSLRKIVPEWGQVRLSLFDEPRMHAKLYAWHVALGDTPASADNTLTVFQTLLNYGMSLKKLHINVAAGIRDHYLAGQRAQIVWTEEELRRFIRMAETMGMPEVADAARLAWETGFRLHDLITARSRHVQPHRIIKKVKKRSRGRRRFAVIPRTGPLDAVLESLMQRPRAAGVDHLLVTAKGRPWHKHQLDIGFRAVRDACRIEHVDQATGQRRPKHLHDLRGTFATRLVTQTDLSDVEIAQIMAWSPDSVARIRAIYVDHSAFIDALGRQLAPSTSHLN